MEEGDNGKRVECREDQHDWRYNADCGDGRVRRICTICKRKEASGWTDKAIWYRSLFTALNDGLTDEERMRSWVTLPIGVTV
jgi:hypothetical protein